MYTRFINTMVTRLKSSCSMRVSDDLCGCTWRRHQLIFFIRALATSAVDLETDKAIQEIIRGPQFASMTMLIIAYVSFSP